MSGADNENLTRVSQSLQVGDRVELFTLDLNPIGVSEIWQFTNSVPEEGQTYIRYRGVNYAAVEVEAEGFEVNGDGAFPQPVIRVSNATLFLAGTVIAYQDLLGAEITRIRTYRQFLDNSPDADPDAFYTPDIFFIEQKSAHTKEVIEWKLSSALDQEGVELPKRRIVQGVCLHTYRRFNPVSGTFDYSKATCPYAGGTYYDRNGARVSYAAEDRCGKKLTDCRKRFGNNANLPTRAFPGVGRTSG